MSEGCTGPSVVRNGAEALVLVELYFLVVTDRAHLFALGIHFLSFETVHPVLRTKFSNLTASQLARRTKNELTVQVNFNRALLARCFMCRFFTNFGHGRTPYQIKLGSNFFCSHYISRIRVTRQRTRRTNNELTVQVNFNRAPVASYFMCRFFTNFGHTGSLSNRIAQ